MTFSIGSAYGYGDGNTGNVEWMASLKVLH
jgi:hypothetical protein